MINDARRLTRREQQRLVKLQADQRRREAEQRARDEATPIDDLMIAEYEANMT